LTGKSDIRDEINRLRREITDEKRKGRIFLRRGNLEMLNATRNRIMELENQQCVLILRLYEISEADRERVETLNAKRRPRPLLVRLIP
jgi:hypothetical protein